MILHTCVYHDSMSTYFYFGSKRHSQIQTLNFVPFPHFNSISFRHSMMILLKDVLTMSRGVPQWILGLKVKVKLGLQTLYRFRMITPFPFDIQRYFRHVDLDLMSTSIDFGVKRSSFNWNFKLCTVSMITPFLLMC